MLSSIICKDNLQFSKGTAPWAPVSLGVLRILRASLRKTILRANNIWTSRKVTRPFGKNDKNELEEL